MSDAQATVLAAVISTTPAFLALVLVAVLVIGYRSSLATMLENATKIGVAGAFEIELDTAAIKDARRKAVTDQQASALDRKVARSREFVSGSRLLWVDDTPSANLAERRYLRSADVTIVNVTTTSQALAELARFDFDVVVTDIERPESATAGQALVASMRAAGFGQPVIAYVLRPEPSLGTPAGMFGITDRPDELVRLYVDAVERVRDPGT